jgi:hypothetical protein
VNVPGERDEAEERVDVRIETQCSPSARRMTSILFMIRSHENQSALKERRLPAHHAEVGLLPRLREIDRRLELHMNVEWLGLEFMFPSDEAAKNWRRGAWKRGTRTVPA